MRENKRERVITILAIIFLVLFFIICYLFIKVEIDKALISYYKDQMLDFCELAKLGGTYRLPEPCSHWIH